MSKIADGPLRLPPRYSDKCGTYAGWNQHQRFYEYPCPPCSKANVAHTRAWRIRTGHTKALSIPVSVLQEALLTSNLDAVIMHLPPEVRQALLDWEPPKE